MWWIFTVKWHFSYFLHRLLFFCISYFSGRDEILWFGLHVWPKSTDASVKNRTSSDRPHFRDKGTIWGGGGLISYYILTRLMALEFLMVASVLVLTQWSEEVWGVNNTWLPACGVWFRLLPRTQSFISPGADSRVPHCKKYLQLVFLFTERI